MWHPYPGVTEFEIALGRAKALFSVTEDKEEEAVLQSLPPRTCTTPSLFWLADTEHDIGPDLQVVRLSEEEVAQELARREALVSGEAPGSDDEEY